ncbi:F0F1 ATP synthase subunit gamma [Cellulomonas hominis]|jgi:F-type H+-transporting ATPase subunit gamma|uniref:ATP synthase gamma chain n=1 Tax=Cellulomonas hominis TaxID=156981 RepID=A0A511FGY3_9CELL|nr:F0F1 ATP synthase subunit gamma [Cellulomonas hominis]MBB5471740.1 F-type H+-transporting ATPase subunit gamma [Cellulomonas hominis]MBU5424734.1 F0F1 ATP synthase subunit gamma [Cellulomonas hominis]NKY06824.1 F0F1 ATP synthase subunit gamma [Cellulomonas hominis]NKY10606.1 F0F1 ATP synthase subunit gamma [Cellulomonas hominis]GEL48516.1 ATP synthase gamma chain [Cellulomonas hominis]
MAGQQRVYRQRIRSTQALKKMFRAQELIAASRIGRARDRMSAASPYARAITRAVSAVATHSDVRHPLLAERTDTHRVAVLLIASDRGMAGAYSASVIRETERLIERLEGEGKEVALYVSGRRAESYYRFRNRELAGTWTGQSDAPTSDLAEEISGTLLDAFAAAPEDGGVGELHIVSTQFVNMVSQRPQVIRMLPLEVVEGVAPAGEHEVLPLYDFEPDAAEVLDALLPRYVRTRIFACLLQAAASELAARQRAMHTATENAEDLIRMYTRLANQARQAEITQEISEIVSGADALAS